MLSVSSWQLDHYFRIIKSKIRMLGWHGAAVGSVQGLQLNPELRLLGLSGDLHVFSMFA